MYGIIRTNVWCCRDEVGDTLPQNIAIWHTEYFKLKEFEKWHLQDELSDLLLRQIVIASYERCLPCTWRNGVSLPLKTKGHREGPEGTGLAERPPDCYTSLKVLALLFCHDCLVFIKPCI